MKWHIETRKVSDLVAYDYNPRVLTKKGLSDLKKSIDKFGIAEPIVINTDNVIIGGHARTKVLNPEQEIEVYVPDRKLDDQEYKELNVRLNKNIAGEWDFDILQQHFVVDDLKEWGFDEKDLKFDLPVEVSEDNVPEVDNESHLKTHLGDMYALGEHRLLCGDSTSEEDVTRLLDGTEVELLFTSPPYADMREYNGGKDLSVEKLAEFIPLYAAYCNYQAVNLGLKITESEVIPYWDKYTESAKQAGLKMLAWNVWNKTAVSIGQEKQMFPCYHEWIFVYGGESKEIHKTQEKKTGNEKSSALRSHRDSDGTTRKSNRYADDFIVSKYKRMESVLVTSPELGSIRSDHPATYPVALPAAYIGSMTDPGQAIADPFGGSGSTLIACEQLKRKCYMMELDPRYCDVIVKRWEQFTGQKAEKL